MRRLKLKGIIIVEFIQAVSRGMLHLLGYCIGESVLFMLSMVI